MSQVRQQFRNKLSLEKEQKKQKRLVDMRNAKTNKNLNSLKTLVCVFVLGLFLSISSFAATANKNQKLNSNNSQNSNNNMESGTCTDCASAELPLPMLPAGIRGLPMLLNAIAPAYVPDADPSTPENDDPREVVLVPEEIKGVGRVDVKTVNPLTGKGSGYMIDKCLAITNKHVAANEADPKDKIITFRGGTNLDFISKGVVVESGPYRKENPETKFGDWSVLKLDEALGTEDKIGYIVPMFMKTLDLGETGGLAVVGLYRDNMSVIKGHFGCESLGWALNENSSGKFINTGTFAANCAALPGTSGGLITTVDEFDNFRAVGLMNNGSDLFEDANTKSDPNSFVPFLSDSEVKGAFTKEVYERIRAKYGCP